MRIEYSPTAGALYLRLQAGTVAKTVEIEEFVDVDVDASGQPLGVEFVVAEEFYPFLERHAGALDVPGDLAELAQAVVAEWAGMSCWRRRTTPYLGSGNRATVRRSVRPELLERSIVQEDDAFLVEDVARLVGDEEVVVRSACLPVVSR